MGVTDFLAIDNLSVALLSSAICLYFVPKLLRPLSQVHPLLLGNQADKARVRNEGESPVYRNYGVGHGAALPSRPAAEVRTVVDLVRSELAQPRLMWGTPITNSALKEKAQAFGSGLVQTCDITPGSKDARVLILLNDCIEYLTSDLALSTHGIRSITITQLRLLSPVVDKHDLDAVITHVLFIDELLELLCEEGTKSSPTVIVLGHELTPQAIAEKSKKANIKVVSWEDVIASGNTQGKVPVEVPKPEDIVTTSYYDIKGETLIGVDLTHQNFTAGPTVIRHMLSIAAPFSPSSRILSAHSLSTPFGRALAYTALYEGSGIAALESTKIVKGQEYTKPGPTLEELIRAVQISPSRPTHLYLNPGHVTALASAIHTRAKESFFYGLALRHKSFGLSEGYVNVDSIWDQGLLDVFGSARRSVLGLGDNEPWFKAVVSAGASLQQSKLSSIRIALSIPFVNMHIHPLSTAPIFASHPQDLQAFADGQDLAHVGAPGPNVEVKLTNIAETDVEMGLDPMGDLLIRGPSIGTPIPSAPAVEGWIKTGDAVLGLSNGTFKVLNNRN
ncbi:hypothetical protein BOTBODRAFT_176607 [Botryobasidium botryosum FD-172 SS1]|uniref:Uncharacterized protein n=1 Tax=Botryobasidium botryosum (strain FD-172 SS1) TaxID=930990 RepID=A0A067M9G0_BOTB1|nr:hypothetical protein BOTBODRAFT_176607 [Botryobasidium botryosum FD-172 SS1]